MLIKHLTVAKGLLDEILGKVLILKTVDSEGAAAEIDVPERPGHHHFEQEAAKSPYVRCLAFLVEAAFV